MPATQSYGPGNAGLPGLVSCLPGRQPARTPLREVRCARVFACGAIGGTAHRRSSPWLVLFGTRIGLRVRQDGDGGVDDRGGQERDGHDT